MKFLYYMKFIVDFFVNLTINNGKLYFCIYLAFFLLSYYIYYLKEEIVIKSDKTIKLFIPLCNSCNYYFYNIFYSGNDTCIMYINYMIAKTTLICIKIIAKRKKSNIL